MNFIEELEKLGVCDPGVEWAKTQPDAETMWANCEFGSWMLWLCGKLSGGVGSDSRKNLVFTACQCARLALPYVKGGEERPRNAIDTAERYCRGEATVGDVINSANAANAAAASTANAAAAAAAYAANAAAASDAAASAANADYASAANADYAAFGAAAFAAAAYANADARAKTLKQCADIVRENYPVCPLLEKGDE